VWHIYACSPLLLLVLSDALFGLQLPAGEVPKPASVAGRVIETKSGEPVRKALVILRRGNDKEIGAYADKLGIFAVQSVEPGAYTVSAEQGGYVAEPDAKPVTVNLKPGDNESGLVLKLRRTGAISGHVFDSDGDPLTGAVIQVEPAKLRKDQPKVGSVATTNDRGEYRAFGIAP